MTNSILLPERVDAANSSSVESMFIEAVTDDTDRLTVDAGGTKYVSSAGLRIFLKYAKLLNARGGRVTFLNVRQSLFDLFEITGMSCIFEIEKGE